MSSKLIYPQSLGADHTPEKNQRRGTLIRSSDIIYVFGAAYPTLL